MKISIIGPGALGCLLAARLAKAHEVRVLDHDPERAAALDRRGLVIEHGGTKETVPVRAVFAPRDISGSELVLLCVKSAGVAEAVKTLRPFLEKNALLVALQNGIAHLPVLREKLPDKIWAVGVTAQGATLAGPGHVIHRGEGATVIGALPDSPGATAPGPELLDRAALALSGAGVSTSVVPDILNHVWTKLLINVGINALTAIHDCPNGELLENDEALAEMKAAVREGREVAERLGISLGGDPVALAIEVCRATSANISSMLQDVRAKRATEIGAINGALIERAEGLGIAVPVNRELVAAVRTIEKNYDDFS